jgi:hypothetical protein
MCAILHALEVNHAVDAGKGCAATLVSMGIELLLCEDIAAILQWLHQQTELDRIDQRGGLSDLTREGYHVSDSGAAYNSVAQLVEEEGD